MSDSDLIDLYSERILGLAADIPHHRRLDNPDASSKKRSPLCGSTLSVDLVLDGDVVKEFGQDVKACALGQASASILGSVIIGASVDQIYRAREELRAMLKDHGPTPSAPFEEFEVLMPARDFKNRHSSILLGLDATIAAIEDIRTASK